MRTLFSVLLLLTAVAWGQEQTHPSIVVLRERMGARQAQTLAEDLGTRKTAARETRDSRGLEVVEDGTGRTVRLLESKYRFNARHVFRNALNGFAAELTAGQIQELETDYEVDFIEPDGVVTTGDTLTWGLSKINAGLSAVRTAYATSQIETPKAGIYVIDTGIASHPLLNVVGFMNFTGDGQDTDCHGHGTHVAGIIGAHEGHPEIAGVAPGAPLSALKVLSCGGAGRTSMVIQAVDWVTANAPRPAVVNMSLGGPPSRALDAAIRQSAASGVVFSVAAMNDGRDACEVSPARVGAGDGVITVAAADSADQEASFSNYGACVDIWAPGVNILSTYKDGGTAYLSGTSMAAPFVAGAAALHIAKYGITEPGTIESDIKAGAVQSSGSSKDGRAVSVLNVTSF